MLTERRLELNDCTLRLFSGPPNGPPLLFLHGVTRCAHDLAPLFPAVLPRWQVHALDFRGHGKSDRMGGRYRVADYVEDALAVLRTFSEPAVLFGHSLGALVAAGVAAAAGDRVRAVILEDPPSASLLNNLRATPFFALFSGMRLLAGDPAPVAEVARHLAAIPMPGPGGTTLRLGELRDPAAVRLGARCLKDVDPDVLVPLIESRWLDGYDVEATMRGVKCPCLILRGEESLGGMLNRAEADQWAAWMADGMVIDVPGVGHLIHWIATPQATRYVLNFLESLR